jgi:uncharacterized membrane protein
MTDVSPQMPEAVKPSSGKKWLYASLALNLLLAGIIGGGLVAGARHHGHGGPPPPMAVRDIGFAFMRALPEERRAELLKGAGEKMHKVKPLFEESMKLRKEAFAMLDQETIDPAALKAAFAKVRAADTVAQTQAGDAFAEMVSTLPVAERRAAVAKIRERWAAREAQHMDRWSGRETDGPPPMPGAMGPPMMGPDGPPPPPQ